MLFILLLKSTLLDEKIKKSVQPPAVLVCLEQT